MKKPQLATVLLLAVSAATACTSEIGSSSDVEIFDSAGVRIVHSRRPQWVDDQAWTVSSDPDMAIGVLDGSEEYQLVDVASAARRSDGSLVVVDRGSLTVRVYDARGLFLRTLGGPGSGPGEFSDPGPLLVTAGDTMVIWDVALLRVTRFDPSGDLAGVQSVDWGRVASTLDIGTMMKGGSPGASGKAVSPGLFPGPMEPLADGGILVRLIEKTGKSPPPGFYRRRSGVVRLSRDLSVIDTLMFFDDTEQVTVDAPWGAFSVAPALAKETEITHRGFPPRICVGDQEGPEIVCFKPDGSRILLRWVSEAAPITDAEVVAWRAAAVQNLGPKLSRDQVLEMLDQVPIPESRPPYSRILLDHAGNLWAERGPTGGRPGGAVDFLVFDPEGILLGVVALPPIRVLEIGDDYVLGVFRDALEIQYLHLYELRKNPD
jgi:hypothetical protein